MPLSKVPIEKINKMPLAYALMIVGGMLGIVATKYFDKNTEVIEAYKQENANLKAENKIKAMKCDSMAGFWQNKYVGSLERAKNLQDRQDSVNKATLARPNNELIKALKKQTK